MAERPKDEPIAPRRNLGGPVLPPPPPELAEESRRAEAEKNPARGGGSETPVTREVLAAQQATAAQSKGQSKAQTKAQTRAEAKAQAKTERANRPARRPRGTTSPAAAKAGAPRRPRRAQLRLVQIDAWSVMKTAFLLSIALGIVLVVAVAIIWSVLGAAGVWDSINSIVQQAVGGTGKPFDIQQYAGTSRVLGFTMIVAVLDVILVTAIATLGAFLYNLSAALLGGIEVTLAEDS
jgi:hypothetical protein